MHEYIGNKHFFTKSCDRQTYQNPKTPKPQNPMHQIIGMRGEFINWGLFFNIRSDRLLIFQFGQSGCFRSQALFKHSKKEKTARS